MWPSIARLPILRLALMLVASCCHRGDAATVHWASEPVEPGQAMLLAVIAMSNTTKIELRQDDGEWKPAKPAGVTKYGCTVTVPSTFHNAEFEVRADGGANFTVNVARPWFAFGDSGSYATPGGWVRIVGEAISLRPSDASVLKLRDAGGTVTQITAHAHTSTGPSTSPPGSKMTRWHAYFALPSNLSTGQYQISVAAGRRATSTPLNTFIDPATPSLSTLNISAPLRWKPDIFRVRATQPGVGRDATEAVAKAVAAAAANGGGVVFFPTGQYFIKGPIIVDPGVILRGASRELVSVYFHEDNQTTAPPAYLTSSRPGAWGIEGLTFYITAFANDIVRFVPGTDGAFFRKNRIRFNSYFCLEPKQGDSSRGRPSNWLHSVGTAVKLAGQNIFVTDNDIFSSGDVVSTLNNGAAGASYMHIARNRLWNGGTTHWGVSWKQCIYEDNQATGASTTAMGSNYPQYAHSDGAPHVQNIYHHNNTQNMVWGNDREMMTCDGGGGVYFGGATSKGAVVELLGEPSGTQPGGSICVLKGTGTGECRRVVRINPGPPPSPPPAPPLPKSQPTLGEFAVLTRCDDGNAVRLAEPRTRNNHSFMVVGTAANSSGGHTGSALELAVWCETPGHNATSTTCGENAYFEPIKFGQADSWTEQYQTAAFLLHGHQIKLVKGAEYEGGGKCMAAEHGLAGSSIGMGVCSANSTSKWTYDRTTGLLKLNPATDDGAPTVLMCLGHASKVSPPRPPPPPSRRNWTITAPYTVDLDESSMVSITPYIGQIAFNGNYYSDGGEIQFYAQAFGVVAAENKFERTGGLSAWSRGYSGVDANLRNSFIDNEVVEGNHVWNYDTNQPKLPGGFPYFPGGSKTVEPWFYASLTNEQGMPIDPTNNNAPAMKFKGGFNRFITFRGNKVRSNGGIVIRGTTANTLVTGSVIHDSHVGIHVNYSTTTDLFGTEGGGIVVHDNIEPRDVPRNYNPYHNHKGALDSPDHA